ncbi:ATP-binding cassette domain-containing protein, partial [Blautia pseudococcoides]|nr:ATP-binding cassette domain-containing protein [Blautia pseudococcoides]
MGQSILAVEHLQICYTGQSVLEDVNLTLEPGRILGIVGESGSGKSTLIRAAMGLLGSDGAVTGGRILYRDKNVTELKGEELRKLRGPQMGMIFQNTGASLCPIRTIEDQLYESVLQHE